RRLRASWARGRGGLRRGGLRRLKAARGLEPEGRAGDAYGRPFHPRRAVVRAVAERRLRRALARGARRDAAGPPTVSWQWLTPPGSRHSIARRVDSVSRA